MYWLNSILTDCPQAGREGLGTSRGPAAHRLPGNVAHPHCHLPSHCEEKAHSSEMFVRFGTTA